MTEIHLLPVSGESVSLKSKAITSLSGALKSVNFWTTDKNVRYEIYVRNSSDEILVAQSGTCAEMGYYTLPLTSRVPLSANQEFKIDVKITTTTGYLYPLPIEKYSSTKVNGQELPYTDPPIQTGVCFIKASDQDVWQDASQYSENNTQIPINVCLRATVDESDTPSLPASSSLSAGLMIGGLAGLIMIFIIRRAKRPQT